ncbi:TPA: GntR family transcriptional regulator [Pseudomonas aeruginosa]|jgi:DNA-binding GntR family transcriptional regulator|uniref:GntR family transcriptional regulator n=1 Tax=Pseudomonas aeruginosa TaxID=287 RepID=UPI000F54B2AE|nr:GntR family transcriptional regulator [Pseudomonas aeruginosa]HEM7588608.1 GntR family transcriptional regulator [Serratia marcescens]EKV4129617.1 GntR family transcriptional regulator [Pseudomonas aeruginosa]EKW1534068.1 GntR family transcriptional regulator [Pseudomonas aeruginosa]ELQ7976427.1 GntR family transcriptional regulator [Pseudomonas aeruginosa]ELV3001077.1 GntR family transcriptional regulator [Pseudomonas aeruginosa]
MSNQVVEPESGTRRHGGRFIYEELRKQILTLKLKPGAPLDEVSLAAQFGLSRSPVRDALARLITEGLVTILPNRTTLVTPFEIEEFPNYVAALDLIQRAVSRLAALQRTEEEMARIRAAEEAYMRSITLGDFQAMTELNKALHMEIARAGKNPYLTSYYEKLLGEGQRLLHLHFDFIVSSASQSKLGRDHEDIVEAIAARDADAAENAAHEHTMLFQRRFLDYMQQNLTSQMKL